MDKINFRTAKWTTVILLLVIAAIKVPGTKAWFSDTEKSLDNKWSAGSLSIVLENKEENFDPAEDLSKGDTTQRYITVKNEGTTHFNYNLEFTTDNPNDLCENALLEVSMDSTTVYSGILSDFTLEGEDLFLEKEEEQEFLFEIGIPVSADTYIGEMTCEFDIIGKAWMPDYEYETAWWDMDEISNSISTTSWTQYEEGDIVINEIMWSGSSEHELDKWIELRNTTDEDIDLTGWTIAEASAGPNPVILSGTISANDYYLITQFKTDYKNGLRNFAAINDSIKSDLVIGLDEGGEPQRLLQLKDIGEKLILKDSNGKLIDETPDIGEDGWAEGTEGSQGQNNDDNWASMERNAVPGDGNDPGNWHTCISDGCNSSMYWDEGLEDNYGTPKAQNLSENDKSLNKEKPVEEDRDNKDKDQDTESEPEMTAESPDELQEGDTMSKDNKDTENQNGTNTGDDNDKEDATEENREKDDENTTSNMDGTEEQNEEGKGEEEEKKEDTEKNEKDEDEEENKSDGSEESDPEQDEENKEDSSDTEENSEKKEDKSEEKDSDDTNVENDPEETDA